MRPDNVLLLDMLLAAREAVAFVEECTYKEFRGDRMRQMATAKAIETVGEAASRLSESFQVEHPQLPWREIIGMRHRLVHDYFGMDLEQVWKTVIKD